MNERDLPDWARRARGGWRWRGQQRPPFAEVPGPGQESVWDYPRPPRIAPDGRRVLVRAGPTVVAETRCALRLLETASPPTWYLPLDDVRRELLVRAAGSSRCEWKGVARYWRLRDADPAAGPVAWDYPDPLPGFEPLRDRLAFLPRRVECRVDGQLVIPQPGGFYGGWITPELVGPFKGTPGSESW